MRAFKNWLKAYVQHTRFSESPDSFHFWTGVATIAGALRRRVWIDERGFQWTPNFYIVLVGPPGVAAKSTSIRMGLTLLEKIPGIFFGPQSMTWQALIECFRNAQEGVELEGYDKPIVMSCLTVGVSELGTFLQPDNRELLDVLVGMWDAQREIWRRQTKGEGETVIFNPWLNIIGCTTPAWLKENFPDVLIGGGLTSRMVFVFGSTKRQLVAYPHKHITSIEYEKEEEYLIHDLTKIAEMKGEFFLSKEAEDWGEEWYNSHWSTERPEHMSSERFDGYIARKQTHVHKLAMVLSAAKKDELIIELDELQEAVEHITHLERSMMKVFSSIGVAHSARVASEVLSLIKNHRQITYKTLWQLCFNTMAGQEFAEAIRSAINAGFIVRQPIEGKKDDFLLKYIGGKK